MYPFRQDSQQQILKPKPTVGTELFISIRCESLYTGTRYCKCRIGGHNLAEPPSRSCLQPNLGFSQRTVPASSYRLQGYSGATEQRRLQKQTGGAASQQRHHSPALWPPMLVPMSAGWPTANHSNNSASVTPQIFLSLEPAAFEIALIF